MLRRLWARWKVIARRIGEFQSRLLLCLFYFVILAPFGLGVRLLSDPLRLRRRSLSQWLPKQARTAAPWDQARRQF
jgi:hypothetical protein